MHVFGTAKVVILHWAFILLDIDFEELVNEIEIIILWGGAHGSKPIAQKTGRFAVYCSFQRQVIFEFLACYRLRTSSACSSSILRKTEPLILKSLCLLLIKVLLIGSQTSVFRGRYAWVHWNANIFCYIELLIDMFYYHFIGHLDSFRFLHVV